MAGYSWAEFDIVHFTKSSRVMKPNEQSGQESERISQISTNWIVAGSQEGEDRMQGRFEEDNLAEPDGSRPGGLEGVALLHLRTSLTFRRLRCHHCRLHHFAARRQQAWLQ
jgi:hypothetical protein